MTYDELEHVTGMSRVTVAAGRFQIVEGWAKLPAKGLYERGTLTFAQHFGRRNKAELFALELYLLFVARRDRKLNIAMLNTLACSVTRLGRA